MSSVSSGFGGIGGVTFAAGELLLLLLLCRPKRKSGESRSGDGDTAAAGLFFFTQFPSGVDVYTSVVSNVEVSSNNSPPRALLLATMLLSDAGDALW